jgi:hypothetical protein
MSDTFHAYTKYGRVFIVPYCDEDGNRIYDDHGNPMCKISHSRDEGHFTRANGITCTKHIGDLCVKADRDKLEFTDKRSLEGVFVTFDVKVFGGTIKKCPTSVFLTEKEVIQAYPKKKVASVLSFIAIISSPIVLSFYFQNDEVVAGNLGMTYYKGPEREYDRYFDDNYRRNV